MIGRSGTFVRGNENNDHRAGPPADEADPLVGDVVFDPNTGDILGVTFQSNGGFRQGQPFFLSGKLPGYFLFNMNARFQATKGLSLIAQVNNLFDKEYFSAGRLDANPFSPSIFGKIGPSGWNYNSKDWQNTTFVSPGAPRALWIGLEYQF
jgi:outer membrane receptor protein involved in Fe transport